MKVSSWLRCAACVLFVCSLMALPGCEEGPETDELTSYNYLDPDNWSSYVPTENSSDMRMSVSSSAASLATDGKTALIDVIGGTAPFSWSVSDISLGSIVEHNGRSAVYKRNAAGDNVVIVKDKSGSEAYCTITQP